MDLWNYQSLRSLLDRHGFRFSKSKGQNFLLDRRILEQIAAASEADRGCGVLEIGPGAGSLTIELAARAGKVAAVELDRDLLPVLAESVGTLSNVEIIPGDALKLDLASLAWEKFGAPPAEEQSGNFTPHVQEPSGALTPIVCANLPYNITTPILEKLIETPCYRTITVLLQKEVARRLSAPPGSGEAGAFSLWLQYHMETRTLFDVPRTCFHPVPNVDSALLRCVRRKHPPVEAADEAFFFRLIRGAFLLRRKTLVNSLSAAFPEFSREFIREAVRACALPENVRGERLTFPEFAALARVLGERNNREGTNLTKKSQILTE